MGDGPSDGVSGRGARQVDPPGEAGGSECRRKGVGPFSFWVLIGSYVYTFMMMVFLLLSCSYTVSCFNQYNHNYSFHANML